MSFTFNLFDIRRTGVKLNYLLPSKTYIDSVQEWASPFRWGGQMQKPAFLSEDEVMKNIDIELSERRTKVITGLNKYSAKLQDLLSYYDCIQLTSQAAREHRPLEDIDLSLPNHEQDRLQDEKVNHSLFESNLEIEKIKLLYNTALFIAKSARKDRFKFEENIEKCYQQAAGILDYLANSKLPTDGLPNEISSDYLRVLALSCLACATEYLLMCRQSCMTLQWEACAHLSFSLNYYYSQIVAIIKYAKKQMGPTAGVATINQMLNFATVKQDFFRGQAAEYHALEPSSKRQLSRLRKALKFYESSSSTLSKLMPGARNNVEQEIEYLMSGVRAQLSNIQQTPVENTTNSDCFGPEQQEHPFYLDIHKQSRRYEGSSQEPTVSLVIPDWLEDESNQNHFGSSSAGSSTEDRPSTPEEQYEKPQENNITEEKNCLKLNIVVPSEDLYNKDLDHRIDSSGEVITAYHQLDILAGIALDPCIKDLHGFTTIFIFDTWGSGDNAGKNKITSVPEIATLLLKIIGLRDKDNIGLVGYVNGKIKVFPLISATGRGLEHFITNIKLLRPVGNHRGSSGSSVVLQLRKAMQLLSRHHSALANSTSFEVLLLSDSSDSTSISHYDNWCGFNKLASDYQEAEKSLNRLIRIHTFAIGNQCDQYLLKAIAKKCRGDYGYCEGYNTESLTFVRSWLLRHVASQQSKVATNVSLKINCQPGITLKQLGSYDLVFDPTYIHDHSADPSERSIVVDDFSLGHSSNIIATLGIPESCITIDATPIATVTLSYTDTVTGKHVVISSEATLEATTDLVTRELHSWLPQMYVTIAVGVIQLSGAAGRMIPVGAGDLIDPRDTIEVKTGRLHTMTSDGTRYTLCDKTSVAINSIDSEEFRTCLTIRRGTVFIVTAENAEAEIRVLEPMHTIIVEGSSYVKVAVDTKTGLVSVNNMTGTAYISTTRDDETTIVELLSLRQTQMSEKIGPITPWTLEECGYAEWLSDTTCENKFLQSKLLIGIHACRTVCAEWIGKASDWLKKGSWDRITESQGNRRCREFLTRFWLRESKHFLTNSMSGLAPETENIRKYVDQTIHIALGGDRKLRKSTSSLLQLRAVSESLSTERSKGKCTLYDTPLEIKLKAESADAKAKEEKDREVAEQNRQRQLRDNEACRRDKILQSIFTLCDTDGQGTVSFSMMQQLVLSLSISTDGYLQPTIQQISTNWNKIVQLVESGRKHKQQHNSDHHGVTLDSSGGMILDQIEFARTWISLTGDCDTPSFNLLMEQLHGIVEELYVLNEGNRKNRSLHTLFRKWDSEGLGYIKLPEIFIVLEELHRSEPYYDEACLSLVNNLNTRLPEPIKKVEQPQTILRNNTMLLPKGSKMGGSVLSGSSMQLTNLQSDSSIASGRLKQREPDLPPPTVDEYQDFKVTLRQFHYGMSKFLSLFTERAFHSAVESMSALVQSKKRQHSTIHNVVKAMNRGTEQDHLIRWDLRHVFDGITSKALRKLAEIPVEGAPSYLQTVAAPICILSGLTPAKRRSGGVFTSDEDDRCDYWQLLRQKLRRDADGLIDFLRNFPTLSLTYRLVMRVLKYLNSPDFDSCRLLAVSQPLAHLCDWVKVILKISFLEHQWDFSADLHVFQRKVSQSHTTTSLMDSSVEHLKYYRVLKKPHTAITLNRSCKGIIQPEDPCERACSRFSNFDVNDEVSETDIDLPDRRLNTPLLRTLPVASNCYHYQVGLPPCYVPRIDFCSKPGVVCTNLHTQASIRFSGRTPGVGYAATPLPVQPPRPSSAPVTSSRRPPSSVLPHRPPTAMLMHTPTPPRTPQVCSRTETEVSRWLEFNNMSELVDVMNSQGYEDLADLRHVAREEETLLSLVTLPGYRLKLKRLLVS